MPFARPFEKITDDIHKFGIQLKESLLTEFDNDDAITLEDKALVHNECGARLGGSKSNAKVICVPFFTYN